MELKDYIRVIRRRFGWFALVMTVVMGGYLTIATLTEKKTFFAKAELFMTQTRASSLLGEHADFFPGSAKMNMETRFETFKSKEVPELAALHLYDAKYSSDPKAGYLFAAERKEADAARPRLREEVLATYQEAHSTLSKTDLLATYGADIDHAVSDLRTWDPASGQWKGTMGKWQERCVKDIAAAIERRYGVEKPEKTQVVRLTVQSDSATKVVAIANALCDAAIEYNMALDNREMEKAKVDAKRKIKENQGKLAQSRAELKEYWKVHKVNDASYWNSEHYYKQLAAVQGEVGKLQADLKKKDEEQVKLDTIRQKTRAQFPEFSFPKDSILSQLLIQRSQEEKALEALLAKYTDAHPDVKKTRHAIEELKQQYAEALQKFQQNDARSYEYDKALVDIERDFLKEELERKQQELADLEAKRLQVDQLKTDEQELTTFIQQLEEENKKLANFLSFADLYADTATRSVDRFRNQPLDPQRDSWMEATDVFQMMWFMFVVAFLLSIGAVFLVEYMDTTLKTEHDIRRHLNLPVLGIIHHQRPGESVLLTELPTKNAFAEKFYTAATIVKSAAQDLGIKTFVVSSTIPKEGKTTISVNLGVALARKGLKVILVDSDLRIPQIHEVLGLDNSFGLSSVLEGRLKAKEVLADIAGPGAGKKAGIQSFLQTTSVENLQVLTSGPIPPDPLSLLESIRMKALVEELKGMADFVLFDTPPLSNVGDTLTLAGLADANIFVVGAGTVEQHQVTWAKHLLSNVEANVLGCFLNHATIEGRSYYYYYNEYKSYRARG